MSNTYEDVQQSLLKFCSDFRDLKNAHTFKTFDFDTHGSVNKLPDSDLIGIGECSIENDVDDHIVTCFIAVSTMADDAYLKRLRHLVGSLYDYLEPARTVIPVVDADTGEERGSLKVTSGVSVLPVARTDGRPLQMIGVTFGLALNEQLP